MTGKIEIMDNAVLKKNGKPRVRFYLNIAGKRYGELEVIRRVGVRGAAVLWECYCHACGSTKNTIAANLRSYTRSCGCLRTLRDHKSPGWKGVGEISRSQLTQFKIGARKRKIFYDLDDNYLWQLFLSQNRKCALSGLPLQFGRHGDQVRRKITASLDRIDSSKPYMIGNVQWVHKHINAMKLNHKEEYFIDLCRLIISHADEKNISNG